MVIRQITLVVALLLALCAPAYAQTIGGGTPTTVGTFLPPPPTPLRPDAAEVLLDVAAHRPNLIIQIKTLDELWQLPIDPFVRVKMMYAINYGSWILTTSTPVTSGTWTGRPWLAIGGHARYFYFAYEQPYDGSEVGDMGGVVGAADGKSVTQFGQDMTAIGMGIAQLGAAKGNKAATATGLGIAGIGLAINAIGLGIQVAEDLANPSPKQGHVDPTGMPSPGGPAGSDPNGPTGQSPPGQDSNGNGNAPSGGVSGGGGEGGGDDGDD